MSLALQELNDEQEQAVLAPQGPVLVVSGPGSGKTRVLTNRIGYLIQQGREPSSILALTFTNKAANEMKERLTRTIGEQTESLWAGTFHSICLKILRKETKCLGYPSGFWIADDDDSFRLIKRAADTAGYSLDKFSLKEIAHQISLWKNQLLFPDEIDDVKCADALNVYYEYQDLLLKRKLMDFDDLLLNTADIFLRKLPILKKWQRQFSHILVDEYQDTNYAQYVIVKLLAKKHRNLFVVGDPGQSIYSFRGADISNILSFKNDYPDAYIINMKHNYRSTPEIVSATNKVLSVSKDLIPNSIWTSNQNGQNVEIVELKDEIEEAYFICSEIVRQNYALSDVAILTRTHAAAMYVEKTFARNNVPYRVIGNINFYQRKEIKDILAYLRLMHNPDDDDAFLRIINMPSRGIGKVTLNKIKDKAISLNCSYFNASTQLDGINKRTKSTLDDFAEMMNRFKEMPFGPELMETICTDTGYIRMLQDNEEWDRLENVTQFINFSYDFKKKKLIDFLDYITFMTDADCSEKNAVKILTCHASKGLEFPVVFVIGLNEDIFPHWMSKQEDNIEEERRLMYVSVSRAMEKLYLTYTKYRLIRGQPQQVKSSRFLKDIGEGIE